MPGAHVFAALHARPWAGLNGNRRAHLVPQGDAMTDENQILAYAFAEHVGNHYKHAAEELLHAYQRNKEAARHHNVGAFQAALHHTQLSKHHSSNAHEHLTEALCISEKICNCAWISSPHGRSTGPGEFQ